MPRLPVAPWHLRAAALAGAALLSLGAVAPPAVPASGPPSPSFEPFAGPRPLAVLIQTDPWAMVLGADTPRVAVYEDGEVIFVKKVGDRLAYHHVRLGKGDLSRLRAELAPVLALRVLKPWYDMAPGVTDQPQAMLYLRDGAREVATSVYGLMAAGTRLPAFTRIGGAPQPASPPAELLRLHSRLSSLDYTGSEEWTPKYVEVMLWDYSYAPDSSIAWPREWPSLGSPRAVQRGSSYSIFLDGAELPRLRRLLATREERGAVEVDGRKMAASFRYAFPGETEWNRAFRDAAKRAAAARADP